MINTIFLGLSYKMLLELIVSLKGKEKSYLGTKFSLDDLRGLITTSLNTENEVIAISCPPKDLIISDLDNYYPIIGYNHELDSVLIIHIQEPKPHQWISLASLLEFIQVRDSSRGGLSLSLLPPH